MNRIYTPLDIEIGKKMDRYNYMIASFFAGLGMVILAAFIAYVSFLVEKYVSPEIALTVFVPCFLIIERSMHYLSKESKERINDEF